MNQIRFQCRCGKTFLMFGTLVSHWKRAHQVIPGEIITVKDASVLEEARQAARRIENERIRKGRAKRRAHRFSFGTVSGTSLTPVFSDDDDRIVRKYRELATMEGQ